MSDDSDVSTEPYAQSRYIFRFPDDEAHFQNLIHTTSPVEIEVGSGKGLFLRTAAAANPSIRYIGLEIAAKYAQMSAKKLENLGLANATCFCADGVRVIDELITAGSIAAVHVYFPDPWWKARHKKRRVLNARMITAIDKALVAGGKFHFWTDVVDYYESTIEMIAHLTKWRGPILLDERSAENDMDYQTHFERRTRRNGQSVYRTLYVKDPI